MSSTTTIPLLFLFLFLLFHLFRPSHSTLHPTDYLALQSLHKSLVDLPGSTFFSSWDFTADPCSFPGVLCSPSPSASRRILSLALGDPRAGSPGLTGRLPSSSLSSLSSLRSLSLVPGRVFGPLPSSPLSPHLSFLALSSNFLSGPIPPSLLSLPKLQTLDLSFNILSGRIPNSLSPSLHNLILRRNRLAGPLPKFSSSPSLLRLDLTYNNISSEIPSLPSSLRYLSLSFNRLSGRIDRVISPLTRLNFLDLSFNLLSGGIPGKIFSFPISDLRLQRNFFSGEVRPVRPVAVPNVDLSYNRLSGRIPVELAAAERIYLNSNRFVGVLPKRFWERVTSGGIRVLYLQHNYLSGMDIGTKAEIPASTSLCIQYNCMVPPVEAPCPARTGRWKIRPKAECRRPRAEGSLGMDE